MAGDCEMSRKLLEKRKKVIGEIKALNSGFVSVDGGGQIHFISFAIL